MNPKILAVAKVLFFLALGIALIWFVMRNLTEEDIAQITNSFREANYFWIGLSLVLGVFSHLSRAVRWVMVLEPIGYKPKTINSFFAILISYLANLAFPRLGEVTRCGILKKYDDIPVQTSFGTVVSERAVDLVFLISIFFLTLFLEFETLHGYTRDNLLAPLLEKTNLLTNQSTIYFAAIIGIAGVLLLLWAWKRWLSKIALFQKIGAIILGFWNGIKSIRDIKNFHWYAAHSIFIWVMYLMMVYLCFFALPETANLGIGAAMAILVIGSIALIVVQGGIGAYPVFVMQTLALYGVSGPVGLAFGWIVWTAQTLLIVIGGTTSLILLPIINRKADVDNR